LLRGNPYVALLPAHIYVQIYYFIGAGAIFNVFSLSTMKAYAAFLVLQGLVHVWTQGLGNTRYAAVPAPVAPR
jgi:hypothetical protein